MNTLLLLLGIVGFAGLGVWAFVSTPPASLARFVAIAGPLILGAIGAMAMLTGRVGVGGPLLAMAFALYARQRRIARSAPSPHKTSVVRTAMLEMELDHDSGQMNGIVLVGTFEGRALNDIEEAALFALAQEVKQDRESAELLEAYLDRRMPDWRHHMDADTSAGQGSTRQSGAMTPQEAYQILGLETGASIADIRKAHRRLMQGVHPDVGGSSFLAARINEAKDVLLRVHDR